MMSVVYVCRDITTHNSNIHNGRIKRRQVCVCSRIGTGNISLMMMVMVVVVMVSVENVKIPVLRDELYCFLLIVVILCLVTDFVIIVHY